MRSIKTRKIPGFRDWRSLMTGIGFFTKWEDRELAPCQRSPRWYILNLLNAVNNSPAASTESCSRAEHAFLDQTSGWLYNSYENEESRRIFGEGVKIHEQMPIVFCKYHFARIFLGEMLWPEWPFTSSSSLFTKEGVLRLRQVFNFSLVFDKICFTRWKFSLLEHWHF